MTADLILAALSQDVRLGAVALLGADLVRGSLRARIVETEAYRGADDPGSHAFRGPTPRNQVMFGRAGISYVYFTYGMHWMLNVTSQDHGVAAAVLIRAARPLESIEKMRLRRPKAVKDTDLLNGPARICTAYAITREQNGVDLFDPSSDLHIESGIPPANVLHGPRIGLAEGKGERHLWRFVDADSLAWVSSPRKNLAPLEVGPDRVPPEI